MDTQIKIEFLDHVAIYVRDLKVSADWYEKVLGLQKYKLPEWGDFPIFMLSGTSGLALFPANPATAKKSPEEKAVRIDHFAFNVTRENFDKAIVKYKALGLDYTIQDHHYFDSIYTRDPDGHKVELTTIKVDPDTFYKHG